MGITTFISVDSDDYAAANLYTSLLYAQSRTATVLMKPLAFPVREISKPLGPFRLSRPSLRNSRNPDVMASDPSGRIEVHFWDRC